MIVARTCAIYHYRSWITDWHSHPTRWFYFTVKVVQLFRAVGSNGASYTITKNLSTDFTAERMLRYIRNTGKCSMEMIVDEMLAILNDRDAYVQKQIEKNRRIDLDDLFIRGFDIRWNEELQDSYVYQIPAIANIDHFEFKSNITFFVGENGSGKSTLLEAFAVACGLNPEGGTANYRFSTYDDYSDLASAIKLRKGVSKPRWSYFLRAESFYTSVTYKLKLNGGDIKAVQGDSGHSQINMVTDVYSHIIDDDRRKNAELFEQAFYEKKNLDPSMHANVAGKTVELPTNVDAELLAKVLSNPEMAALLSTLAKSLESK